MESENISGELAVVGRICRKLSPNELTFLIEHCDQYTSHLIIELLYNCIYNEDIFKVLAKRKKFEGIRAELNNNKKDILKILKVGDPIDKRVKLMKKQVGSGLITALVSALATIIPALIK